MFNVFFIVFHCADFQHGLMLTTAAAAAFVAVYEGEMCLIARVRTIARYSGPLVPACLPHLVTHSQLLALGFTLLGFVCIFFRAFPLTIHMSE